MLQRAFIHLSLVLLFAFTQMGVATHEISHFTENSKQHQQDKNHHQNQCEQCIAFSHAANAPLAHSFVFNSTSTEQIFFADNPVSSISSLTTLYSARAPPTRSQA